MKGVAHTSVSGIDRPTDDEIIAAVAAALDAPEAVALVWLVSMFRSFDPKAAAERLAARGGA